MLILIFSITLFSYYINILLYKKFKKNKVSSDNNKIDNNYGKINISGDGKKFKKSILIFKNLKKIIYYFTL